MVKLASVLFWCGLVLVEVNSVPLDFTNDAIDLSFLPLGQFDTPRESTGERVKAWKKTKTSPNPDELGDYFQSDILLPKINKNGLINMAFRWPNAIVPFVISGKFSREDMANIEATFKAFKARSCIRFVKRTNQRDYIDIKSNNTGCWSYVGRNGGPQALNLQTPGCTSEGIPAHEFLHALGFFHQQSSDDRDKYVNIHLENVIPGQEHNFNKYPDNIVTSFKVRYDFGSIMHYSNFGFSKNGNPTITTKPPGIPIGQRKGLSRNDWKKLNIMYGCKGYY